MNWAMKLFKYQKRKKTLNTHPTRSFGQNFTSGLATAQKRHLIKKKRPRKNHSAH